jgi:hypothetical protein
LNTTLHRGSDPCTPNSWMHGSNFTSSTTTTNKHTVTMPC